MEQVIKKIIEEFKTMGFFKDMKNLSEFEILLLVFITISATYKFLNYCKEHKDEIIAILKAKGYKVIEKC